MKRPMSRHQDLRFITTLGQTQEQSLLMYPTAEEEEEEEEAEGAAGLLLLLAIWEFFRAFMAAEQATCQFNLDIMQIMRHRSIRIQL